jgi:hypothetical protein
MVVFLLRMVCLQPKPGCCRIQIGFLDRGGIASDLQGRKTCPARTDISSIDERASRIASVSVAAAPIVPQLRCGLTTYQNQVPWPVHTSKAVFT